MIVYVATKGINNGKSEILGVFKDKDSADDICMQQKTFTRCEWKPSEDIENCWHNDNGLYVRVLKFNVY